MMFKRTRMQCVHTSNQNLQMFHQHSPVPLKKNQATFNQSTQPIQTINTLSTQKKSLYLKTPKPPKQQSNTKHYETHPQSSTTHAISQANRIPNTKTPCNLTPPLKTLKNIHKTKTKNAQKQHVGPILCSLRPKRLISSTSPRCNQALRSAVALRSFVSSGGASSSSSSKGS